MATLGESRVRLSFNPSGNTQVDTIKEKTANLIDYCQGQAEKSSDGEEKRLWALAMTHFEDAAMWAVKAATAPK